MMDLVDFESKVKKYFAMFEKTYGFEFLGVSIENSISMAVYDNDRVRLSVLYGPPEFHVEIELAYKDPGSGEFREFRLGDLIRDPGVREWLENNKPNVKREAPDRLDVELCCFSELLRETCDDALKGSGEFFRKLAQ